MMRDMTGRGKAQAVIGAVALLIVGGAAGAAAIEATRPTIEMAPMVAVPIARLGQTSGPVTLKGRVAERFGHMFVLADGSGRALVDTGPRGDSDAALAVGAPTTVQGRFDRGIVHASFLVDAQGSVTALAPPPPPPGPHGPPPPHAGPDAPPPPLGADAGVPPHADAASPAPPASAAAR